MEMEMKLWLVTETIENLNTQKKTTRARRGTFKYVVMATTKEEAITKMTRGYGEGHEHSYVADDYNCDYVCVK